MRLGDLSVELRPRTPWEAVELGIALVRRHAGPIWRAWMVLTLPVFIMLNALGWALDRLWLASLLMWWLKPVFDRIPLYVISRAVFGPAPGVRDTIAGFRSWGWRPMLGYLSWRRLGPVRALYLPIDLLEGGPRPSLRRSVVGGGMRGHAALLTLVCANFELVLVFAMYVLALMFVPIELLSESARAAWELLSESPPRWIQLIGNLVLWFAASVIEPFYVGAGFGLYLDRRTRIEAWDVEIAFRRLRARLRDAALILPCLLVLALSVPGVVHAGMVHSSALSASSRVASAAEPSTRDVCTAPGGNAVALATADGDAAQPAVDLKQVFGRVEDDRRFSDAARALANDPLLHPRRTVTEWQPRNPQRADDSLGDNALLKLISKVFALLSEYGMWLLVAAVAVGLAISWRTWLPWLRGMAPRRSGPPAPIEQSVQVEAEPLPADVLGHARALWSKGQSRAALALLYRASVAAMAERTGALLVPGATEAQCLRAARALKDDDDRAAFARMVTVWQYAAYAERLPDSGNFESLLVQLGQRFGWAT
ncbi:MAG: DUF4129 domain-containing protein [Thermomonas sp.]|uniref:DUF4129 domain-containing protein n=1 Tax=Thermomonas sp. TaxID=1971895 RepID=UPI00262175DC|nr:DUF4129 domain-containing protein [Thermomonas sp.]MCC7097700.1 DUF4129 domain-containing protein [Thermomonas sp.]